MIVKIFTIGFFLFVGLKLVYLIVKNMSLSKSIKHHFAYSFAFAELIIWLIYFSWVTMSAYNARNNFVLIFLGTSFVLLIVPVFILIRDLIFGIFLKVQNKIPLGTVIEFDDTKGRITKTGYFFLNIEDTYGNIKSISYYKLNSKVISSLGDHHQLEKLEMVFNLPHTDNMNELTTKLIKQLLSTPWVAVSQPLIIEKIKRKNDLVWVKIGLFTLNKKYEENIKALVEKNYLQE